MKIKYGFVTNSSSSNFLLLGISDQKKISQAKDLLNYDEDRDYLDHGYWEKGGFFLLGGYYEIYYAGIEPHELLETMTLPEAKKEVQKRFQELGMNVDISDIELVYGEFGEG